MSPIACARDGWRRNRFVCFGEGIRRIVGMLFGEDLTLPLGEILLDPSEELANICDTTPYICESNETTF